MERSTHFLYLEEIVPNVFSKENKVLFFFSKQMYEGKSLPPITCLPLCFVFFMFLLFSILGWKSVNKRKEEN